jgi:multicomponent Na+:H+ antiporter subunit G
MSATLGWLTCGLALIILLIAALGVYRLPDALARQHAVTKAATLGVTLFALGTGLLAWDAAWTWRLLLLVAILFAALPLASHALGRAAASAQGDGIVQPESAADSSPAEDGFLRER